MSALLKCNMASSMCRSRPLLAGNGGVSLNTGSRRGKGVTCQAAEVPYKSSDVRKRIEEAVLISGAGLAGMTYSRSSCTRNLLLCCHVCLSIFFSKFGNADCSLRRQHPHDRMYNVSK